MFRALANSVLSVSTRPRPMSREFDLPKEGRSFGFSLCDCSCKIVNRCLWALGVRNSHARMKRRTEAIWEREREGAEQAREVAGQLPYPSARKAVLELAEKFRSARPSRRAKEKGVG